MPLVWFGSSCYIWEYFLCKCTFVYFKRVSNYFIIKVWGAKIMKREINETGNENMNWSRGNSNGFTKMAVNGQQRDMQLSVYGWFTSLIYKRKNNQNKDNSVCIILCVSET